MKQRAGHEGIRVWGAHFRPHPVRSDPGGAPPYRPLLNFGGPFSHALRLGPSPPRAAL